MNQKAKKTLHKTTLKLLPNLYRNFDFSKWDVVYFDQQTGALHEKFLVKINFFSIFTYFPFKNAKQGEK